jgi:hypothetical protein
MDMDTLVLSNEVEQIFPVLSAGVDLTAAFERCALPDPRNDPGGPFRSSNATAPRVRLHGSERVKVGRTPLLHGWELHTGVVGFTDSTRVAAHANATLLRVFSAAAELRRYSSFEQQAETIALAHSSIRWMPLPPNFAIRYNTVTAAHQLPRGESAEGRMNPAPTIHPTYPPRPLVTAKQHAPSTHAVSEPDSLCVSLRSFDPIGANPIWSQLSFTTNTSGIGTRPESLPSTCGRTRPERHTRRILGGDVRSFPTASTQSTG